MALLFSEVAALTEKGSVTFLASGTPKCYEDLEGWRALEDFLEDIVEPTKVLVGVQSYLYGEGEQFIATPEEVAYFHLRKEARSDFLQSRCQFVGESEFSFDWNPGELFGLELGIEL